MASNNINVDTACVTLGEMESLVRDSFHLVDSILITPEEFLEKHGENVLVINVLGGTPEYFLVQCDVLVLKDVATRLYLMPVEEMKKIPKVSRMIPFKIVKEHALPVIYCDSLKTYDAISTFQRFNYPCSELSRSCPKLFLSSEYGISVEKIALTLYDYSKMDRRKYLEIIAVNNGETENPTYFSYFDEVAKIEEIRGDITGDSSSSEKKKFIEQMNMRYVAISKANQKRVPLYMRGVSSIEAVSIQRVIKKLILAGQKMKFFEGHHFAEILSNPHVIACGEIWHDLYTNFMEIMSHRYYCGNVCYPYLCLNNRSIIHKLFTYEKLVRNSGNVIPVTEESSFILRLSSHPVSRMLHFFDEDIDRFLDIALGGYLHRLDMSKSYITGSMIAAVALFCRDGKKYTNFQDYVNKFYPSSITRLIKCSDEFFTSNELMTLLEPKNKSFLFIEEEIVGEELVMKFSIHPKFSDKSDFSSAGLNRIRNKGETLVASFSLHRGCDVDICVATDDMVELKQIAENHFSVISVRWPNSKFREISRKKGTFIYEIYSDDILDYFDGFRDVQIYSATGCDPRNRIITHHVPCVRGWRGSKPGIYMASSFYKLMRGGNESEVNEVSYVAGKKKPFEIVLKWMHRGIKFENKFFPDLNMEWKHVSIKKLVRSYTLKNSNYAYLCRHYNADDKLVHSIYRYLESGRFCKCSIFTTLMGLGTFPEVVKTLGLHKINRYRLSDKIRKRNFEPLTICNYCCHYELRDYNIIEVDVFTQLCLHVDKNINAGYITQEEFSSFVIWSMMSQKLLKITEEILEPHIPKDCDGNFDYCAMMKNLVKFYMGEDYKEYFAEKDSDPSFDEDDYDSYDDEDYEIEDE